MTDDVKSIARRSANTQADILSEGLRLDACKVRISNLDRAHHALSTKVCRLDNNWTALLLTGSAKLDRMHADIEICTDRVTFLEGVSTPVGAAQSAVLDEYCEY